MDFISPYRNAFEREEMQECHMLAPQLSGNDLKQLTMKYMRKDCSIDWASWKRDALRFITDDSAISDVYASFSTLLLLNNDYKLNDIDDEG